MAPNDVLKKVPPKELLRLLAQERKFRASGKWGPWETIPLEPGQGGDGWAGQAGGADLMVVVYKLKTDDFSRYHYRLWNPARPALAKALAAKWRKAG